jgi:hypothetical protein
MTGSEFRVTVEFRVLVFTGAFSCYWGDGNIVLSKVQDDADITEDKTIAVGSRMKSRDEKVEILGESDGKFGFHLSLPFVVGDLGLDEDASSDTENSGKNQVNLAAILVGVVLSMTVLW